MKYNILGYLIGEGFRNVFKNKKSTGASLMIMCATMLIFGLFFLIGENVNHIVTEFEAEQGMQVFIEEDATEEQIEKLGEEIKAIENVATAELISKEEAFNIMKSRYGDEIVLAGFDAEHNPFKVSYVVNLIDLEQNQQVVDAINELENVHKIQIRSQEINALISVANGVRIVSGAVLVLLVIISVFIIANTIKLTVHARRKEISIMKYVGATNNFIRWPFVVEGIIIGILAAMLSILLLGLLYNFTVEKILESSITNMINIQLLSFSEIFSLVITVYLALGIGIGTIGSLISMRKYLEV